MRGREKGITRAKCIKKICTYKSEINNKRINCAKFVEKFGKSARGSWRCNLPSSFHSAIRGEFCSVESAMNAPHLSRLFLPSHPSFLHRLFRCCAAPRRAVLVPCLSRGKREDECLMDLVSRGDRRSRLWKEGEDSFSRCALSSYRS